MPENKQHRYAEVLHAIDHGLNGVRDFYCNKALSAIAAYKNKRG